AAAVELHTSYSEFLVQELKSEREIELLHAGKNVGDAVPAQAGEMRVAHLLGQNHDDRIVFDIGTSPGDPAVRIEHHAVSRRITTGEPWFPRIGLVGVIGICFE